MAAEESASGIRPANPRNHSIHTMLPDLTDSDEHSSSARLLRMGVWLCVLAATAVFWVAVAVLLLSLMA